MDRLTNQQADCSEWFYYVICQQTMLTRLHLTESNSIFLTNHSNKFGKETDSVSHM